MIFKVDMRRHMETEHSMKFDWTSAVPASAPFSAVG